MFRGILTSKNVIIQNQLKEEKMVFKRGGSGLYDSETGELLWSRGTDWIYKWSVLTQKHRGGCEMALKKSWAGIPKLAKLSFADRGGYFDYFFTVPCINDWRQCNKYVQRLVRYMNDGEEYIYKELLRQTWRLKFEEVRPLIIWLSGKRTTDNIRDGYGLSRPLRFYCYVLHSWFIRGNTTMQTNQRMLH